MTRRPESFDIGDQMAGAAGMLGAAANVIMQLGNPGVGWGVVESTVDSGNVMIHPIKRLRTTLTYLVVALFGTEDDRTRYRQAVNRSHVPVHSGPDSPVTYNAFDPALQLWVAACLYVGFRDMREYFLGPMDDATADGLYDYCHRLGTSLQVPREAWPEDRDAFAAYWSAGLAQVHYDEPVRAHLLKLVDLGMMPRPLRWGNAQMLRFFTIGMLPVEVRTAMRLPWTDRDQQRFDRWIAVLRILTRLTPRWARVLPIRLQLAEVRLRMRRGWRLV
jgi:uncharacterized protein (DUF2236 family)